MIRERVYVWVLFSVFTYLNTENERMKIIMRKIYFFSKKKKHFLKYSQTEAMVWGCSGSCFSEASTYSFIKKRDPCTGVFLRILQNFQEHLFLHFLQNTSREGFCFKLQKYHRVKKIKCKVYVDQLFLFLNPTK